MGWLARTLVLGATIGVVGCATLAGLEEPTQDDSTSQPSTTQSAPLPSSSAGSSGTSGSSGSSGASGSSGTSGSSGSSGTVDASADTGAKEAGADTSPPPCTKGKTGDACNANGDCCSNACGNDKKCTTSCRGLGSSCTSTGACCVNTVCSGIFLCAPQL